MVVIVGASHPIPLRRRNRNALAAGIWLVFLLYRSVPSELAFTAMAHRFGLGGADHLRAVLSDAVLVAC